MDKTAGDDFERPLFAICNSAHCPDGAGYEKILKIGLFFLYIHVYNMQHSGLVGAELILLGQHSLHSIREYGVSYPVEYNIAYSHHALHPCLFWPVSLLPALRSAGMVQPPL